MDLNACNTTDGWKCLIRYLMTPQIITRQGGEQQQCRRQCGHQSINRYIFWSCPKFVSFWDGICQTIGNILGYVIPGDPKILLLGLISGRMLQKETCISLKFYQLQEKTITRSWLKSLLPQVDHWQRIVEEIHSVEKLTYLLRIKGQTFNKRWTKWFTYKSEEA